MPRFARSATLLVSLLAFVLQLPLVGAGVACAAPRAGGVPAVVPTTSMMHMGAAGRMATSAPAVSSPTDQAAAAVPADAPCDRDSTPAACHSMTACAGSIALPSAQFAAPARPRAVTIGTVIAVGHPSRTVQPDIPPPRA